jgi:hypothetical protein
MFIASALVPYYEMNILIGIQIFALGSISTTFYGQLLQVQIPKAQKDTEFLTEFLCFWDLCA